MRLFLYKYAHSLLVGSIIVFSVGIIMFSVFAKPAHAMLGFGGKIVSVITCPCSANLAIFVAGVKGGVFSFEPGSLPFAWYQIFRPGPWTKGTYVPGNVCLWPIPFGCAGFPTMGTIIDVGTSM